MLLQERIDPRKAVDILGDAFIEDLRATVPGPDKHPNATGNLLSALTERSAPMQTGPWVWTVGVGNKTRLGVRGEKRYAPKPIERFLKWYRGEAEEKRKQERKRASDIRAKRMAEKKAALEAKALAERQYNLQLWYNHIRRQNNAMIRKLYNRRETLKQREALWEVHRQEIDAHRERTGWAMWTERIRKVDLRIQKIKTELAEVDQRLSETSEALKNWQRWFYRKYGIGRRR